MIDPAAKGLHLDSAERVRPALPQYLRHHYWWAYLHPNAIRLFERQWLVNLILWGNYRRLCDAVLDVHDGTLPGRSLQVACAYGDLTERLARHVEPDGMLDVIDIVPGQIENLARKLPAHARVRLHCMDAETLRFGDREFDHVLLFFLLHEQPEAVRARSLAEAVRVLRPGGTLTIVDYALPHRLNPLRYLWKPVLDRLEPFVRDLWHNDVTAWLPLGNHPTSIQRDSFFGGLYQLVNLTFGERDPG